MIYNINIFTINMNWLPFVNDSVSIARMLLVSFFFNQNKGTRSTALFVGYNISLDSETSWTQILLITKFTLQLILLLEEQQI